MLKQSYSLARYVSALWRHSSFMLLVAGSGCGFLHPADSQTAATNVVTVTDTGVIVRLDEGDRVTLDTLDAELIFLQKISESRCPRGVDCIWAGEAKILIAFQPKNASESSFELSIMGLADADSEGFTVATLGYRFTLLELIPYPDQNQAQPSVPAHAVIRLVRE
jgi:hypothetical protein